MSVLVEALTLLVPRHVLDAKFPGGTGAYLTAMRAPDCPARMVCADAHLTSVSFHSPADARRTTEPLLELGLRGVEDGRFHDLAIVDQWDGPTVECPWVEWRRHPDGYSFAWLSGRQPGALVAPASWTPEQSRALSRTDIREEPGRMMRLAADGELETWLDFRSGAVITGPAAPLTPVPPSDRSMPKQTEPLIDIVIAAVEQNGWSFTRPSPLAIVYSVTGDRAAYDGLVVTGETIRMVTVYCAIGARVPADRRVAVAEAIARANFGLPSGGFELDFSDGELRYKVGLDFDGGVFTPAIAHDMIGLSIYMCDRYHDALMRVAFGDEEPATAIEQAESA